MAISQISKSAIKNCSIGLHLISEGKFWPPWCSQADCSTETGRRKGDPFSFGGASYVSGVSSELRSQAVQVVQRLEQCLILLFRDVFFFDFCDKTEI